MLAMKANAIDGHHHDAHSAHVWRRNICEASATRYDANQIR